MTTQENPFSVETELNGPPPRVGGYQIMVKINIAEKSKGGILLPETVQYLEKYRSSVGRVVAMGPDAYKGERFKSGPWCKLGDWVVFPKHEGHTTTFRKFPVQVFSDDRVLFCINTPDDIGGQ